MITRAFPLEKIGDVEPKLLKLVEGEIISIDVGSLLDGYYGDHAKTFMVGNVDEKTANLVNITRESLYKGIEQAISGNNIGDIGYAIQDYTESFGYGVVREMVGHGVGKELHESPEVPNYGKRGKGIKLKEGLVIAIEPMINMGTKSIHQHSDGWTITTADGDFSAHFEHTIVVQKNKAEILSSFKEIEKVLSKK